MSVLSITVPILDPILVYFILISPNTHIFLQFCGVGLLLLNWYWYSLFVQKWVSEYKSMFAKSPEKVTIKNMGTLIATMAFAKKMSDVKKRMNKNPKFRNSESIRGYATCDLATYEFED